MAQLYFYYSAMNAGKSTSLIQSYYNYHERGMKALIFTYNADNVKSRIGLSMPAIKFENKTNLMKIVKSKKKINCILIDECHFLSKNQVEDLIEIVDILNIPVLCYGLRTDFQARPFIGSIWLLLWADKLIEIKTICFCGRKANRVLRVNEKKSPIFKGKKIVIGGNEIYISVCRKHFQDAYKRIITKIKF